MKFAVFASGNGSNLQAIIDAVQSGKIRADLCLVFSDKESAYALTRARAAQIPVLHINPKAYATREAFDAAVLLALEAYRLDFIVLAGYMRLLSPPFIRRYQGRIINIHPSLLPAFKGAHAIADAFKAGVDKSGVSVHIVVEEMDAGPLMAQKEIIRSKEDTLESFEAKIHRVEHELYPQVIADFVEGKFTYLR